MRSIISLLATTFACATHYSSAQVQEFTDKADWAAAVNGRYTTIDFTQFPAPPPITYLLNQTSQSGLLFVDGFDIVHYTSSYENDGAGVAGQGYITALIEPPAYSIAADFPGVLQFRLYSGAEVLYTSSEFGGSGTGFFGGVVSTQPFNAVLLFRERGLGDTFIDDLHFGPSSVSADLTHDAVVGPADLAQLLAQWGACPVEGPCSADFNDDGLVGPADLAELLAGWSQDCNNNGQFDHFEVITVGDCNDNGAPDGCDIAAETSLDCNQNGTPDECELKLFEPIYVIDDGTNETQVGLVGGGPMVWFNHFTVQTGFETISAVDAAWGVGPATIAIWIDPTDDGDPQDAVLVTTVDNVPLTIPEGGPLRTVPIPPTFVGNAGESFYVGLLVEHDADQYPGWLDTSHPIPTESWWYFVLEDLSGAQPIDAVAPGNWLVRASIHQINDNDMSGVPDECETVPCAPDLSGNDSVGPADLAELLASWGDCPDCPADLDGNDNVGPADLAELLANWGACP